VEAWACEAMGLRALYMRRAAIGPVSLLLRAVNIGEAKAVIDEARSSGDQSVRPALERWLKAGHYPT